MKNQSLKFRGESVQSEVQVCRSGVGEALRVLAHQAVNVAPLILRTKG